MTKSPGTPRALLLRLRHTMHGRTIKALGTVETSNHSHQAKALLNEALGAVETSNHSHQAKAPNEALGTMALCEEEAEEKSCRLCFGGEDLSLIHI